jgi:hypothetical protein
LISKAATAAATAGGVLLGLSVLGPESPPAPAADNFFRPEVKWVRNWKQGLAEAERTGKPLWVVIRCER